MATNVTTKVLVPDVPDQAALKRVGEKVRKRLAVNKDIYTLPTDQAEIFALGDFMSPDECRRMIKMIDRVAKPSKVFDLSYGADYRTSY